MSLSCPRNIHPHKQTFKKVHRWKECYIHRLSFVNHGGKKSTHAFPAQINAILLPFWLYFFYEQSFYNYLQRIGIFQ